MPTQSFADIHGITLASPLPELSVRFNKVCVVGCGMVGGQVARWFESQPVELYKYDPSKGFSDWDACLQADIYFVSVPTPYQENGEYDLTKLNRAIEKIPDGKIVVLKSTVNPGTTDEFQNKYPNKTFVFNPEFLTELTAWDDFVNPDMQILGVPYQAYAIASSIMQMLPKSPIMRIVSPIDAELIKKSRNAFYALKVIFFNQLYDIISNINNADYETVRSTITLDPRIGNSHSFIFHKELRGFGGKCLPKDLYSFIDFAKKNGTPSELFEVAKKINLQLNGGKK